MNFSIPNFNWPSIVSSFWPEQIPSLSDCLVEKSAKKFSKELFPGTFDRLRYKELDSKLDQKASNRAPGYGYERILRSVTMTEKNTVKIAG